MAKCPKCESTVRKNANFCGECGQKLNLVVDDEKSFADEVSDFAKNAYSEVENVSRSVIKNEKGAKIAAGAAVGAASGAVLPVVGWVFGAAVGAGIAAYNQSKK